MRKETLTSMKEASKTDSKKIFIFITLAVLAINVIIGAALNPLEAYLAGIKSVFAEVFFYLIKLLSLVSVFASLGAAYHLAAFKKEFGTGVKIIALCAASTFLGSMIAAIIHNFDVVDGSFFTNILSSALGALINAAVSFLIPLAGFYFPFRMFLRDIDVFNATLYKKKLIPAAISAASISAVYNLIILTIDTVNFITVYSPLYTNEIVYIIYEYVFVFATSAIGAFIVVASRKLYSSNRFKNP